ncbi:MAG: hypothetical protein U0T82_14465 [Bacteroidales bacterium]
MTTSSMINPAEFTPILVNKAALCLSCKKNDIEEWDDEQACHCQYPAEAREEKDFFCFAYEPLW